MGETVAGGVYLAADGETYHDANGKPVESSQVSEAQKIQRQESELKTATLTPIPNQSNEILASAIRSLLVPGAPAATEGDAGKAPKK